MFGFVNTDIKPALSDNNDLHVQRKRNKRNFLNYFLIFAFSVLNFTLYVLTKTN